MLLSKALKGVTYTINNIVIDEKIKRRLEVLGLTQGTSVSILNKNFNGSLIIKFRGTRFAISKKIAAGIDIEGVRG